MTQAQLAARAGIPRNQVVRAERGDNITLDTLRKIAAHLPIESLTLLEKLPLKVDILPQPEKFYVGSMLTLAHLNRALGAALEMAGYARTAMVTARREEPLPFGEEGGGTRDDTLLLKRIETLYQDLESKLQEAKIA